MCFSGTEGLPLWLGVLLEKLFEFLDWHKMHLQGSFKNENLDSVFGRLNRLAITRICLGTAKTIFRTFVEFSIKPVYPINWGKFLIYDIPSTGKKSIVKKLNLNVFTYVPRWREISLKKN